jgi:2,3-bisphosphoglycerate-dependent phosphoglycerate mutase
VKRLYVVRHCRATGQEPDAPLTEEGRADAVRLGEFLAGTDADRVITSPFKRARDTAEPIARQLGLPVQTDDRLSERVLSSTQRLDWLGHLEHSFADVDFALPGGESSRVAMLRASAAVDEVLRGGAQAPVIVTHGNLMTLLLRRYDRRIGYSEWRNLTNPDVFLVLLTETGPHVKRLWK